MSKVRTICPLTLIPTGGIRKHRLCSDGRRLRRLLKKKRASGKKPKVTK